MPQNKTYLANIDKSKLDKLKRVKLGEAKKIQLSLIDDSNTLIKKVSDLNDVYDEFGPSLEKNITLVFQAIKDMEFDMEVLEKDVQLGDKVDNEVIELLGKLEDSAKALGLSASDLPSYDKLESDWSTMMNKIADVEDLLRQANQLNG